MEKISLEDKGIYDVSSARGSQIYLICGEREDRSGGYRYGLQCRRNGGKHPEDPGGPAVGHDPSDPFAL